MKTRCVPLVSQDLHAVNGMWDAYWLFYGKDEAPKTRDHPPEPCCCHNECTRQSFGIPLNPSLACRAVRAPQRVCLCLFIETEQVGQASCFGFVFVEDSCYMTWLESSRSNPLQGSREMIYCRHAEGRGLCSIDDKRFPADLSGKRHCGTCVTETILLMRYDSSF